MFDILDIRAIGLVTAGEFLAALKNVPLGQRVATESWALENKVQLQVRQELASVKRGVSEMKLRVKQGLDQAAIKVKPSGSLSARSEVSTKSMPESATTRA